MRQLPDGMDVRPVQLALGGRPHVQKLAHRRRPYEVAVVRPVYDGDGIGLLVVAAELREHFVPAHPDGHRAPQLVLHAAADLAGNLVGVPAVPPHRSGDVEPALVQAEGLYQVGVLVVYLARHLRVPAIQSIARRQHHHVRAFPARLPKRFGRLDAVGLRLSALREHDAVAQLLLTRHHHGPAAQLGPLGLLHAGVEGVHVAMQDDALQTPHCASSIDQQLLRLVTRTNVRISSALRQSNKAWRLP